MEVVAMQDFAGALGASKAASALLVLFVPSKDRGDRPIDQAFWVDEALKVLGLCSAEQPPFPKDGGYGVTTPRAASFYSMSQ